MSNDEWAGNPEPTEQPLRRHLLSVLLAGVEQQGGQVDEFGVIDGVGEDEVAFEDFFEDVEGVFVVVAERHFAADELVETDAHRPEVDFVGVLCVSRAHLCP